MQFRQAPQSMQCKIAILIIALAGNVLCIRNGGNDGNDEQEHISTKLKNFFPSEPLNEVETSAPQTSARVTNGGFRPSQMLEFTPSDVMPGGGTQNRFPPSYLAPNYKHQVPSSLPSLQPQQSAMDKQFSFPNDEQPSAGFPSYASTPIPTTPVVSYLDPFTQQNYRYTPTPPTIIQYQREQPQSQGDQVYTVQSSLLVGNHNTPQQQRPHAGVVEDVYLKRPGYVFDESPSTIYRRPTAPPPPPPSTAASHKISYDSHDYPPPSYASQQTSNFVPQKLPQRPLYNRQDVNDNRPLAASSIQSQPAYSPPPSASAPTSSSSNYANNFGNYLQRPQPPPQTQYQSHSQSPPQSQYQSHSQPNPTHYQQQRPRPGHNYYEYQIGEIPPQQPQQQQQFNYRPEYRPPYQPPPSNPNQSPGGGLATLASLFSSTQQYAPQFTNLLLGGGGGPSSSATSSSSPLGSLLGAFAGQGQGYQQHARPPNTQLIRALENIARNDDLQCVPKVLCQMIAGQTLRGQLPSFITSPAITNFLAGFPASSPALLYGRAALLGLSGGDRSCIQTYVKCPKNEMEIIHYLNNHRGGFFKFFSEPEEQPAAVQQSESGGGSFFSILSALTGGTQQQQPAYTTPRPRPRPTEKPSTDIANGIGSFFTQVLSEYLNGVEYQRRRRRRRRSLLPATEIKRNFQTDDSHLMPVDFHDEEDNLDTQTVVKFQDDDEAEAAQAHTELIGVLQFPSTEEENEGRILHYKGIESEEEEVREGGVRFPDATAEAQREVINDFNRVAAQRKLRFPQEREGWKAVLPNGLSEDDYGTEKRRGKRIVFRDTNEHLDDFREEELRDESTREEQLREERLREVHIREEQLREERLREVQLRKERLREDELREAQLREERLRDVQLHEDTPQSPPNAVYEEAAPPQRGARVIFPDHYERYIRKGKILNHPTYAPTYEYPDQRGEEQKEQRLVLSNEHRPSSHYRYENFNQGEYMPSGNVRFDDTNDPPSHYNYPNTNYITDNRYSSGYQKPKQEHDKNIYVTNSQGVNEYYIKPDGRKVYYK